jgi:hypothetical protein
VAGDRVDHYVRHARQYGGLRDVWDSASAELSPSELGKLADELTALSGKRRADGFKLSRADRQKLLDHAEMPESGLTPRGIIANKNAAPYDCPSSASANTGKRICEGCDEPIPSTKRADARYHGPACEMKARRRARLAND